eukprot:UN04351
MPSSANCKMLISCLYSGHRQSASIKNATLFKNAKLTNFIVSIISRFTVVECPVWQRTGINLLCLLP